jgi:hypothetical protein
MAQPINRLIIKLMAKEGLKATTKSFSFTEKFIAATQLANTEIAKQAPQPPNITTAETMALQQLKRQYVMKPVDKGLGIAVITKESYIELVQRDHLSDTHTYKKLDHDPSEEIANRINQKLDILLRNGMTTIAVDKTLRIKSDAELGKLYILPKLHKAKLGTRPIVSNTQHPTKPISKYLHDQMLPTAKRASTYIENSLEMVRCLRGVPCTIKTYIITADITSLYTNIPNGDGASEVAATVSADAENAPHIRNQYKTRELLKLVLENNGFEFNNEYYIQRNGTAMGTIMAPTYANIYLRGKEERQLHQTPEHIASAKIHKRYIDDVFILYENTNNDLPKYISLLRAAYAPLQLTLKIGRVNIPFLDLSISINDITGTIEHSIYQKPHSIQEYISTKSQHPPHIQKSIVYNDLLRTNRLTTNTSKARAHEMQILSKALAAGYDAKLVGQLTRKARQVASEPTKPHEQTEGEHEALLKLTYNGPNTDQLIKHIRHTWNESANSNAKIKICTKTNPNLNRKLVSSRVNIN